MKQEPLVATIRLAEAAPGFIKAALDLLEAVDHADPALLEDSVRERADEFHRFIEDMRGSW